MKTFSGLRVDGFSDCHCQGIAIDAKREYMYFSFTTSLVKTDLEGNIIGSVIGIIGHLGCLAYNDDDGRVYASLEYNDDEIGCGILRKLDIKTQFPNRFYVAIFDVEKIEKIDMDAEKDGIMTAVCIKEVNNDYNYPGHKYGCSGIDGITFAPCPGEHTADQIYVAYGIYSDKRRKDNDHQIILRFDKNRFSEYEKPLKQSDLHECGPEFADDKYFIFTGNTTYGIQNLEYDQDNNCMFAAVYKGKKLKYPNYSLFAVDLGSPAENKKLKGINERGNVLPLKMFPFFNRRFKIYGSDFPYGSTGMISLGKGQFIFSVEFKDDNGHGTDVCSYKLYPDKGFIQEKIFL